MAGARLIGKQDGNLFVYCRSQYCPCVGKELGRLPMFGPWTLRLKRLPNPLDVVGYIWMTMSGATYRIPVWWCSAAGSGATAWGTLQ
jgi:hypothetical protein